MSNACNPSEYSIVVLQCKEFLSGESQSKDRYMVVSESAFLLLELDSKCTNLCTLIMYASLSALEGLERNLEAPNRVTLDWNVPLHKVVWTYL